MTTNIGSKHANDVRSKKVKDPLEFFVIPFCYIDNFKKLFILCMMTVDKFSAIF